MAVLRGFEGQKRGSNPRFEPLFPANHTKKVAWQRFQYSDTRFSANRVKKTTPILVSLPEKPRTYVVHSPNPARKDVQQKRACRRKLTGKRHAGGGAHPRRCPLRARNRRSARTAGGRRAAWVSTRGGGTRWRGRRRSRSRTRPRPSRARCRLGRLQEPCCRCPLRNICPARCRCCTVSRL